MEHLTYPLMGIGNVACVSSVLIGMNAIAISWATMTVVDIIVIYWQAGNIYYTIEERI